MKEYTVFLKINGSLETASIRAKNQKAAKRIAESMYPNASIGYVRLVDSVI